MNKTTISTKSFYSPLTASLLNFERRFSQNNFKSIKGFNSSSFSSNAKNLFSKKKLPKLLIPLLAIVILVTIINSFFRSTSSTTSTVAGVSSNDRFEVKAPLKTVDINREFAFPIKDDKGKEISKFKYIFQDAELKDEIVVKGKRATAVKGRLFLIVNIKVVNDLDKGVQINSRDYVRLVVNGNEAEKIAADIHNDPIDAQAISTKTTRLGFAINETDKDFVLQVGEIKGQKESINLSF